jgi:hypothetical protein
MEQVSVDQVIAKAVDAVIKRMIAAAPKHRVLVLFSGASSGYVAGMDALQALSQGGHQLTVVMTASAMHVIGEDNARKAGATRIVGVDEWANPPGMIQNTDLVLIPTLSMNSAARLALGLMDSLVSTLVLGARLAGKPVIAVCDGANPYGNGGRVFGDDNTVAPALRARLADNLTTLMSYGIHLVTQDAFLHALFRQLNQPDGMVSETINHAPVMTAQNSSNGANHILTAGDLMAYQPGETVKHSAGTRLTPLAQETVRRMALRLVAD